MNEDETTTPVAEAPEVTTETPAEVTETNPEAPSAADLDAVAAEQQTAEATADSAEPAQAQTPQNTDDGSEAADDDPNLFLKQFEATIDDVRSALAHLRTSSNAEHKGTIVADVIARLAPAVEQLGHLHHKLTEKISE